MKKLLFPLLLAMLVFQSCTIEKRHFRPGYHIEWKNKTWNLPSNTEISEPLKEENIEAPSMPAENTGDNKTIILRDEPDEQNPVKEETTGASKASFFEEPKDDTCDVLIKMNGDEVSARVTKITPTSIEYKRCDIPDGPLYVEKKSAVFMIKFQNGTKEVFSKEEEVSDEGQKTLGVAPFSILFTVAGVVLIAAESLFFIPAMILGLAFGMVSLIAYRKYPGKYLRAAKIMSIVSISLCGLVLAILLGALLLDTL